MRLICRISLSAVMAAAVSASAYAGKCSSTDIPLSFTINSTYTDPATLANYTSSMIPDGKGAYLNGQQGVTAVVTTCNGSDDATLTPGTAGRSVTFSFQNAVDTNSNTPPWRSTTVFSFYFSKVLHNYNPNLTYSFTTYLKATLVSPGSGSYDFNMENPLATAPANPPDSVVNAPCVTSLVNVTHYPATSSSPETWIAWPDSTTTASCTGGINGAQQVGTLEVAARKGTLNGGQFQFPFYVVMQRLP